MKRNLKYSAIGVILAIILSAECYSNVPISTMPQRIFIHALFDPDARKTANRTSFFNRWTHTGYARKTISSNESIADFMQRLDSLKVKCDSASLPADHCGMKGFVDKDSYVKWYNAVDRPVALIVLVDYTVDSYYNDPEVIWISDSTVARGEKIYYLSDSLRSMILNPETFTFKERNNSKIIEEITESQKPAVTSTPIVNAPVGNTTDIDSILVRYLENFGPVDIKRPYFDEIFQCGEDKTITIIDKSEIKRIANAIYKATPIRELESDSLDPDLKKVIHKKTGIIMWFPKTYNTSGQILIYHHGIETPELIWIEPGRLLRNNYMYDWPQIIRDLIHSVKHHQ